MDDDDSSTAIKQGNESKYSHCTLAHQIFQLPPIFHADTDGVPNSNHESKLVTASSQQSVYGTAEADIHKLPQCLSLSASLTSCSTRDEVSSILQSDSLCDLHLSPCNSNSSLCSCTASSSNESIISKDSTKINANDDKLCSLSHSLSSASDSSKQGNTTHPILPLFKKDGRSWLHKSSAAARYGVDHVIASRFKKDSRVWLHKTSQKKKLFTVSDSVLYEVELSADSSKKTPDLIKTNCGDCPVVEIPTSNRHLKRWCNISSNSHSSKAKDRSNNAQTLSYNI